MAFLPPQKPNYYPIRWVAAERVLVDFRIIRRRSTPNVVEEGVRERILHEDLLGAFRQCFVEGIVEKAQVFLSVDT